MLHQWFPCGHLLLSYLTIYTLPFHISFTTLTMEKEQHIRVCNPLLQVDCEGPTLISYIVCEAFSTCFSWHNLTPPYVPFGIRRFLFWAPFEIAVHELHIACLTQFIIGHYKGYYWAVRDTPITKTSVSPLICLPLRDTAFL